MRGNNSRHVVFLLVSDIFPFNDWFNGMLSFLFFHNVDVNLINMIKNKNIHRGTQIHSTYNTCYKYISDKLINYCAIYSKVYIRTALIL